MKKHFYKFLLSSKHLFPGLLFLLLFNTAFSQQNMGIIKGNVSDATGPLPGASISIAGTKNGITADLNGNYTLKLAPGTYTIIASFSGYTKIQVNDIKVIADEETVKNIVLVTNNQLQQVDISYGTQSRRDITGSVSELKAKNLEDQPIQQFAQELQGQIAGVQVVQSDGAPGRGFDFRIRGAASLSFSNQPLFVVDGLPVTGGINTINPDEIETFTILKDAAASALYGSRASNGVVLITTKHAKPGESQVVFDMNYGEQVIDKGSRLKLMNAEQYATFENEYYQDKLLYEPATKPTLDPVFANPSRYGVGTNWFDVLTRNAPIQSYNVTVSTAREHSSSTVIAGYSDQEGTIINTNVRQFNMRINQDFTSANNKLKIGFNMAGSYHIDHNTRTSMATEGVSGLIERISEASPLSVPVNPDGTYPITVNVGPEVSNINPYAQYMLTQDNYFTTRILGNGYLNYEILKGLTLKTNLGVDKVNDTRNYFQPGSIVLTGIANGVSSYNDNYSWTAEGYLNYEKTFGRDHRLSLLAGYSAQQFNETTNSISGNTFSSNSIPYLNAATNITQGIADIYQSGLLSTIGRLNYSYKDKYLLQGAIRRDGSSHFGSDNQYGVFPSISGGWIVSDEAFMDKYKAISYLKIRTSYGITGNNNFGGAISDAALYPAVATIGSGTAYNYTFNNVLQQGLINSNIGNQQLRWERNKQFDAGFDLSLINNRISVTYDYYNKTTDGMIQARQLPGSSGFASVAYNIGAFQFWGHEFTVNTINTTGDLKWTSAFNISFDRNLVTNLVAPGYVVQSTSLSADDNRNAIGHPLGMFYGFIFQGFYKDAADVANSPKETLGTKDVGVAKFADFNNDGQIDANDRTFIGNPNPKFLYGLSNSFRYKNFDLNITMNGSYGNQIMAYAKWAYTANLDGARGGLLEAIADRWRSPSDPGAGIFGRTETNTTAMQRYSNTQWLESGSYLACKNINLGYNIPLSANSSSVVKSIRVYASVSNAFIITKYDGGNPEVSVSGLNGISEGVDQNAYPISRTFSLGLSSRFK